MKVGPGLSARARWLVRPDKRGSTARVNTSTPMPPIQWVKERQKRTPRGRCSISRRMVEPVVVKPETASKYASTMWGMAPEKTKGKAPKKDRMTQLSPATAMPSRAVKSFRAGLSK